MNTASDIKGRIFDIQRFCLHDGPGIRTTVFFKGCPLKCKWCHNPESWKKQTELFYHGGTCIGCGACVAVCKSSAHSVNGGVHLFDRSMCIGCLDCADACPTGALETTGKEMTVREVLDTVLRDVPFYKDEGGITISGGEPFMQGEFLLSLLKAAKSDGLHICVETSGCADINDMLKASEYVDIFLYDCKLQPGEKHKFFVGSDGVMMHENLKALDKSGTKIILRCPVIPDVNDSVEHFVYISDLAGSLKNLVEIHLQPYHTTGIPKMKDIGMTDIFQVEDFDAKSFKERIKNELSHIVVSDKTIRIL